MTRIVALGDSLSCGEGVGIHTHPHETWVGLLTGLIPGATLHQFAVAGARVDDVRDRQLPIAVACRPDLATVLVGLNDIVEAGFRADTFRRSLDTIVRALTADGATVLLGTLHDPTALRPLPAPLLIRRQVASRVEGVNDAVRDIAARTRDSGSVRVVDVTAIEALRALGAWHVDRVHPAPAGHRLIAAAAVQALAGTAHAPVGRLSTTAVPDPPGRLCRGRWLVAHGVPWLAHRGRGVVPAIITMARGAPSPVDHFPTARRGSGGGESLGDGEPARGNRPGQGATVEPALGCRPAAFDQVRGTPEVARAGG